MICYFQEGRDEAALRKHKQQTAKKSLTYTRMNMGRKQTLKIKKNQPTSELLSEIGSTECALLKRKKANATKPNRI